MNSDEFLKWLFVFAALITVGGALYKGWRRIVGIVDRIKTWIARAFYKVPKKTLIVQPAHPDRLWWGNAAIKSEPAMHVVGDFYLTNITDELVSVPKAYLIAYHVKWLIPRWKRIEARVVLINTQLQVIPARNMDKGHADWFVVPPVKKKGESLRAKACFVDQFGNEHWTPVLRWRFK